MAMAGASSLPNVTTIGFRNPSRSPLLRRRATAFSSSAKFQLFEILGGRGLCGGEQGLEKELKKTIPPSPPVAEKPKPPSTDDSDDAAFEKELLGLTGGFPGGEKGLQKFIDETSKTTNLNLLPGSGSGSKPKPPELPLFMPGMTVIVKNPGNPYHMYTGIVQRVTDGKAGVLFEGGNWDKLLTFQLHELQRRDKGPPMVNPKSAVLESIADNSTDA